MWLRIAWFKFSDISEVLVVSIIIKLLNLIVDEGGTCEISVASTTLHDVTTHIYSALLRSAIFLNKHAFAFALKKNFLFLQNVQTGSRALQPPFQWLTRNNSQGLSSRGVILNMQARLLIDVKINEVITSTLTYGFVAWAGTNFPLFLRSHLKFSNAVIT
jgi:hypothetical protein